MKHMKEKYRGVDVCTSTAHYGTQPSDQVKGKKYINKFKKRGWRILPVSKNLNFNVSK